MDASQHAPLAHQYRDRIRELRRVPASSLLPHPLNWRTHPLAQRRALAGVLAEIGYADALLARELSDGSLQLIDGHLRTELTPDAHVPVLVLDVDEQEASLLLATLDPLASLAETDTGALSALLQEFSCADQDVAAMLANLAGDTAADGTAAGATAAGDVAAGDWVALDSVGASAAPQRVEPVAEQTVPETLLVQIECPDEATQRRLYERLQGEGYRCRLLVV